MAATGARPTWLYFVSLALLAACSPVADPEPAPASLKTYYIPAVNEEYAPRDIQAQVKIEQAYLQNPPFNPSHTERLSGIVFSVDWTTMGPTKAGPLDPRSAATVSLRIVPADALARGLDRSRPDYSSYNNFANQSVVGHQHGLARRTNNRQSRKGGPTDELFTPEDGEFDFLIECYDPGNEANRFCAMHRLTRPSGRLAASRFALKTSVVFHRNVLARWREIDANVQSFVKRRAAFVRFKAAR